MDNQLLQYESGQNAFPMSALVNSGDNKTFSSQAELFSAATGFAATVMPNGVLTGATVDASATANKVSVGNGTANIGGAKVSVPAAELTVTRASTGTFSVNSVTITSAGVYEIVVGSSGASSSEVRGAAGGPALIPVGSVEVAQVRLTSTGAAVVKASEILSVPGLHRELANSPVFSADNTEGTVVFNAALPAIHVGNVTKAVYASYAEPIFADIDLASDFVPSENAYSLSSTQVYGGTVGSTSVTLNAASFKAYLEDGIADPLIKLRGQNIWFRFYPDQYKSNYILEQGILGVTRSYPAGGKVEGDFTINPSKIGVQVEG